MEAGDNADKCGDKRKAPRDSRAQPEENAAKKPWGTTGPPPPEWIEMMRKKKHEKLVEKQRRRIELGLPEPSDIGPSRFNHGFIQRPMLRIPGAENVEEAKRITIMTYNVLAQALIRRRMFPFSGDALKWKNRSAMLGHEIKYYNPTIICMQEVDREQYDPFFVNLMQTCNYDHVFLAAQRKLQGLLIAWKKDKYELVHRKNVYYDLLDAGNVGPTLWTGNIALLVGLKGLEQEGRGVWISNTHLFWHPLGSYERMRQAGILVSETTEFAKAEQAWPILICGDFNSTPSGMTYTALTQRPIQLNTDQQNELEQSVAFDIQGVKDEEEDMGEESDYTPAEIDTPTETSETHASDVESNKLSSAIAQAKEYLKQKSSEEPERPTNITAASLENNAAVIQHHARNPPLKSLYSEGLKVCQSDNAVNAFGEPPFTNWAQGYRETLDYIFLVDQGEAGDTVKLTGLLRMPKRDEMGEGEPQEGRFPSDHVCEIAEIELP